MWTRKKDYTYRSLLFICASLLIGCNPSSSSNRVTNPTSGTNTTTSNPFFTNPIFNDVTTTTTTTTDVVVGTTTCPNGTGNEAGIASAGQTNDFIRINNPPVVVHGAGAGEIVWSSETDLPSSFNQDALSTNARFNVRVIPRRQFFGTDSRGRACAFQPRPYSRLQVGVTVRRREDSQGSGNYFFFDNVPVDCASPVREFSVPANTAFPLIIELSNIKWDWSCQSFINQGFDQDYLESIGFCPFDNVWLTECIQMDVQVSTDTTLDIPGPRAN